MTLRERLRALPRRWLAVGGAGASLLVVIVAVLVSASGEPGAIGTDDRDRITTAATPSATTTPSPATTSTTSMVRPTTTNPAPIDLDDEYKLDVDENDPAVVARPIPEEPDDTAPPTTLEPPPWAASTRTTAGGHLGVDVGCTRDRSAQSLDAFFAGRVGPVLGWDYQHVYPLGGDRFLWLFQDTFVDHAGVVTNLGKSRFVHNAAMLQQGTCFTLLHRGTAAAPRPFEEGDGAGGVRSKWFWPMGGELGTDGQLWVFWAEMVKDPYDPAPPDGLGWHPQRLFIAAYDRTTLERTAFLPATDGGVTPIYGYAVSSDAAHTYLFGNTFEQNLVREGGFWNGPHSATQVWLARVPRGQLLAVPEYRTADGWSPNRGDAVPIVSRFYAENPMQPRFLDGQWVSATDVDGYWGDALAIDVAPDPWGPWTTVDYFALQPRGNDPLKNAYHAHLLPWRDSFGSLLVTISNNARNMLRDAWPRPDRYRPMVIFTPYRPIPPPPTTTTTTTTTSTTSTTSPPTTPAPSTTTTTLPPTTTRPPTTTTSTTRPPTTTATTASTSTTTPTTTSTTTTSTTTSTTPATTAAP